MRPGRTAGRRGLRRVGAAMTATVLALGLAACGGSGSGGGDGLRIGIKFDQPGMGLKQGKTYKGFDIDVARYIAGKMGVPEDKITWTQAPSAQRETLIQTGQVDLVIGTYTISDARKKKVGFAGPYLIAGQDLLVRSNDTSITGPDTLSGKRLCSVKGSTSAQNIQKKVPGVNLQEFSTYSECVAALVAKGVDALTTDDAILAGYAAQEQFRDRLRVVSEPFTKEPYGVGLKKGNTELCGKVTSALEQMEADGSWNRFVQDNLGPAGYKPSAGNPPKPEPCS